VRHEDGDGSGSGWRSVIRYGPAKQTVVARLRLLSSTALAASGDDGDRRWDP
jgi:hypothetical protein